MKRLATVLAVLSLALVACSGAEGAASERIPGVRPGVALPAPSERIAAPDTAAPLLGAPDETISLAALRGKVVVLNFWASWCGPCRAEQPDLNEAHASLPPDEVAFLGVDIQDSEVNGLGHVREFQVPYPSIFDPASEYAARFEGVGPRSIPTTIIIDQQGRVAARLFGITNTTEVIVLTEMLLDEAAA